jgi:hypothetical protein
MAVQHHVFEFMHFGTVFGPSGALYSPGRLFPNNLTLKHGSYLPLETL